MGDGSGVSLVGPALREVQSCCYKGRGFKEVCSDISGIGDRMKSLTPSPNLVDTNLKITHIECHPECMVVVFKGQCKVGCELDYYILQSEMQRVFKVKDNVDIGGSCLVEDAEGKWHRGKVLEKKENICKAFLIDTGQVLVVEEKHIASAGDDFFQLPPKVVWGIFANILPLGEKWGPKAINYFSSLVGLQITGRVKSVTSYQLFILEVPKVISDILELQLGKLIDGDSFCLIVEMLKVFPPETFKRIPQLQQKHPVQKLLTFSNSEKPLDFWPVSDLFPHLPAGSKVNVKITVAISLSKFYCQIQERQKELENLTEAMCLHYEAISTENNTSFYSLGLLCAAKRQNGQWHRGVIKQLLSDHMEVWFMDFGNIEAVPSSCVQKLKVEFMSLPVISFPCALSCFGNKDEAVINLQLKKFIQALTGQTSVCVCVDLFNASKHLYYVTLQSQNFGINAKHPENLKEASASFVPPVETKISSIGVSYKAHAWSSSKNHTGNNQTKNCLPEWDRSLSSHCKRVKMQMNTSYTAFVVYVINPSNFWIQTCAYQKEFQALMKNIANAYNHCGADDWVLENPEPGLLCCARYSKDMHYYRGVVTEVLHVSVTVYFLDFGNTDTVPCYDVKTLLPEFAALPALAICCELACTFPVEDVWVKKATDFFKEIVFNKQLLFQVIGKQNNKYIVNAQYRDALQESSVAALMAQAGYAEYWERRPVSALNLSKKCQAQNPLQLKQKYVNARCTSDIYRNNVSQNRQVFQREKTLSTCSGLRKSVMLSSCGKDALSENHKVRSQSFSQVPVPEKKIFYKELMFKPGAVFEVVCSYSVSPVEFSCQLQSKLPELNTLMKQIQIYYKDHTIPYKTGQVACVVKCPKDGKWYRASVLQQVSADEVDVFFVDYGYRERVLLNDLQAVVPDFLTLESQAFQCMLKNVPVQTDALNWPEEKCRHFKDFISAARGPLTCTVFALILLSPNCLCNIVDLQTPFISAEEFLRECGLNQSEYIGLQRLAPLGSMYSFYYSSFNIEIGNEEEVYITHIHSPSKFYCQLNRNSETIEALMRNVTEITKMANHAKHDTISTRLCIARYFEDGLYYRALVSPVESTSYLCADFVDFGNKHMVEGEQLMPIPDSATDLIFTPMQAIKCCLSDFKDTQFPARVIRWFEETFLGKLLKAVIVSRESDGQIVLELYDGQLQVGQKVKEKILEELAYVTNYTEQFVGSYGVIHHIDIKNNGEVNVESPERIQLKNELEFQVDSKYDQADNGQNFGDEEQIACRTQNQCCGSSKPVTSEGSEVPGFLKLYSVATEHREKPLDGKSVSQSLCHPSLSLKEITVNALSESCTEQLNYTGQQERDNENIPKLISLPQRDIQVNSEVAGYISHINSPSSFYIQFAEDENIIIQLAEELNEGVVNIGHENSLGELMVGDLILAEYAIDCFYYRAVIKTLKSGNSFEVEFIDYGNTAVVSLSKICRIQKKLLTLPRLSIHCFLSTVKSAPDESWTNESTCYFVNKINNKLVTCKFLEQDGEQWKVDIICDGKSISDGFQQKSGRTSLQNKPVHSWEHMPKQILVTNDNPQDRKSVSDLGGQRKNQTAKMENNSKMCLNVPPQDLNTEQVERAEIINASAGGEFHVQLLKNLQILNDLNVMLVKEAQRSGLLTADNIEEGLECMVKSERNLKWYRSKVVKIFFRERLMLVFFIDYGNYEMVSLNNAKILSDEMKSIPKQAVLCEWVWLKMNKVPFVHVVNALLDGEIKILFLRYLESSHIWEVEILVGKVLLQEYLNQLLTSVVGLEKSSNTDCMEFQESFRINSITWTLLQSGRRYPGFATAVTDPSNFSIHFEDLFDSMKNLFLLLSDVPDDLPALPEELVSPGNSCLIQFGLEEQWNRVQISEVTSQSVVLTFIDYGFLKSIPCSEIHRLKAIPESLSYLPPLAYSCSLHGIVPATGEYWSDEAKLLFQKLLSKPDLILHFKHYGSGMRLEVDVLYEENNVGCALVAAGHAVYSAGRCCPIPVDGVESAKTCLQPNYPNSNCCGFLCEPDYN